MSEAVAKRRWLPRYGLRSLLVLVTLLGIGLAYVGNEWHRLRQQRQAVAQIEAAGGRVGYDYEFGLGEELGKRERESIWTEYSTDSDGVRSRTYVTHSGEFSEVETPDAPEFLRKWFGNDVFSKVEVANFLIWFADDPPKPINSSILSQLPHLKVVALSGPQVSDQWLVEVLKIQDLHALTLVSDGAGPSPEMLRKLASLKKLRCLYFGGDWVTDETIASIEELSQLTSLSIGSSPNISPAMFTSIGKLDRLEELQIMGHLTNDRQVYQFGDEGTEHLRRLKRLRSLELLRTSVGDATLAHVAELRELEEVSLGSSRVGDHGMSYLSALPKLRRLDISGTRVTDAGLEPLSRLPNLLNLDIAFLDVSDEGMQSVARMKQMGYLNAPVTLITDEGLMQLIELKNLKRLSIGPNVTNAGEWVFRRALPACDLWVSSQQPK